MYIIYTVNIVNPLKTTALH